MTVSSTGTRTGWWPSRATVRAPRSRPARRQPGPARPAQPPPPPADPRHRLVTAEDDPSGTDAAPGSRHGDGAKPFVGIGPTDVVHLLGDVGVEHLQAAGPDDVGQD